MINERYKWPISIVLMILSVIFMISLMHFKINTYDQNTNKKTLETVLDKESVTDISINISDENWNWLMENALEEEYRNADITINGETFYNVGIRPKGNSTLTTVANDEETDRFSFKVKFDEYVENQSYHGIDSIVLNNIIQDPTYIKEYISYDLFDFMGIATPEMSYSNIKINDKDWGLYLAIEVVDKRYLENNFGTSEGNLYKPETMEAGKGGGGGNPSEGGMGKPPEGFEEGNIPEEFNEGRETNNDNQHNEVNKQNGDEKHEIKENVESFKAGGPEGMEGPGFGGSKGGADFKYIDDNLSSYSVVRDSAVFKRTTDNDFKKVINMFKNLNEGTNLEEVLDIEEVLKYFAINTYLTNFDSYSGGMYHNYYLYEKDGRCQILPWDFNLSFGGFSMGGPGGHGGPGGREKQNNDESTSSKSNMINFPIDKVVTGNLEDAPLIGKLLEVDEYKEMYHSYLKQIAQEYFESGYYENLVNKIDSLINDYVKNDATAFYGYDKYVYCIPQMILWGEDRTKSVIAQLNGEQPSTEYGDIESKVDMDSLTEMGMGGPGEKDKRPDKEAKGMKELQENNDINSEAVEKDKTEDFSRREHNEKTPMNHAGGEIKSTNNVKNFSIIGGYLILSLAALMFVMKFKRKGR